MTFGGMGSKKLSGPNIEYIATRSYLSVPDAREISPGALSRM
jgi:hypothetical protein